MHPQDLVVTILGSYVRGVHETVWSGGLVNILEQMGFTTAGARVALTRLVRRDLLARVRTGRLVFYKTTQRSESLLGEGDLRIFGLGDEHGDGTWTVVWHDLPEERRVERVRLVRRLRFFGFGSLQDSLWVSPLNFEREVVKVVKELDIEAHASVLTGRAAESLPPLPIMRAAWDLPDLVARYRAFHDEFAPAVGSPPGSDAEAFILRTRLIHSYRAFAVLDPGFPDRTLDDPQARPRAIATFEALYDDLAPAAQRHFDATALGP